MSFIVLTACGKDESEDEDGSEDEGSAAGGQTCDQRVFAFASFSFLFFGVAQRIDQRIDGSRCRADRGRASIDLNKKKLMITRVNK